MLPSSTSVSQLGSDPRNLQTYQKPSFSHSQSQQNMAFSSGAIPSTGNYQTWGASSPSGHVNDPFTPSRSHYQPGFLMSANQSTATPPGSQHFDEPPLIPTKFNPSASRTSPSEFGLESMFERSTSKRQRQPPSDDDAPPTASVSDIMDEAHVNPFHHRLLHESVSPPSAVARRQQPAQQVTSSNQPVTYLNVFGYPLDRYENIVKLFQSLGDTTDPEPSENGMWFTIGFRQSWEAERALRRNGKIMDDTFMIGVARSNGSTADGNIEGPRPVNATTPASPLMVADNGSPSKDIVPIHPGLPRSASSSLGLPLTLAPSSTAFKPSSARSKPPPPQTTPQRPANIPESSTFAKISDMVFGW